MPKVNNVKCSVIYESEILRMNSSIILTFTIAVLSMSTKILFGFLFQCRLVKESSKMLDFIAFILKKSSLKSL